MTTRLGLLTFVVAYNLTVLYMTFFVAFVPTFCKGYFYFSFASVIREWLSTLFFGQIMLTNWEDSGLFGCAKIVLMDVPTFFGAFMSARIVVLTIDVADQFSSIYMAFDTQPMFAFWYLVI